MRSARLLLFTYFECDDCWRQWGSPALSVSRQCVFAFKCWPSLEKSMSGSRRRMTMSIDRWDPFREAISLAKQ